MIWLSRSGNLPLFIRINHDPYTSMPDAVMDVYIPFLSRWCHIHLVSLHSMAEKIFNSDVPTPMSESVSITIAGVNYARPFSLSSTAKRLRDIYIYPKSLIHFVKFPLAQLTEVRMADLMGPWFCIEVFRLTQPHALMFGTYHISIRS
jgi:hypothetical protein